MRTVFVLFDSLNRLSLGPYGAKTVETPSFDRLAARSVTFDNHYVGSMPCIPARRDMQTGRLSFMHRSWGPMEPFDNSFPEILEAAGVYSHLITDHLQYFRDGGATYHTRYTTYDYLRGQHGDAWKAEVAPDWRRLKQSYHPLQYSETRGVDQYHHIINRQFLRDEADYPLTKCFDGAVDFLSRNRGAEDWFLQVETFDPHEPFNAPARFKDRFPTDYDGPVLDWPPYARVRESPDERAELCAHYRANLAFCDEQLGRLLDQFDAHGLWDDTALVVSTDHGFLLGEHDWWAKNRMPLYEEIAHIPLFVHHPGLADQAGTRRRALTQTIDLMPTFLELHGCEIPAEVTGQSLLPVLAEDVPVRDSVIFGTFGSAVNVCDGRHVFMLYPEHVTTEGLYQYTVMPTTLNSLFEVDELARADLVAPFDFTKGSRLLRTPAMEKSPFNPYFGPQVFFDTETALFDLAADPAQERPFRDDDIELELGMAMREHLLRHDAPGELYARLGLPTPCGAGPVLLSRPDAAPAGAKAVEPT
jgi:arylsulfatase A-like enzyme